MSDDTSQLLIPASFIALFVPPGRIKPTAPREHIAERYEFCEDLAQLLVDQARTQQFQLGIAEQDVLERVGRGLAVEGSPVTPEEARWVLRRLAELLDWPAPEADGLDPRG